METTEREDMELLNPPASETIQIPQRMEEDTDDIVSEEQETFIEDMIELEPRKSRIDEQNKNTKSHQFIQSDHEQQRKLFEKKVERKERWLQKVNHEDISVNTDDTDGVSNTFNLDEWTNDNLGTSKSTARRSVSFHVPCNAQNKTMDLESRSNSLEVQPGHDDSNHSENGAAHTVEQQRPRNNKQFVRLISMPLDDNPKKSDTSDQQPIKNLKWFRLRKERSSQQQRRNNKGKECTGEISKDDILRYRIRRRNTISVFDNEEYCMMKHPEWTGNKEDCPNGQKGGFTDFWRRHMIVFMSLLFLNDSFERFVRGMLHRTFRSSFMKIWIFFLLVYMTLITAFALLAFGASRRQPNCFVYGYHTVAEGEKIPFVDSWHLSWTTISTVGYGAVSPGLTGTTSDGSRCVGINVLMAFESFVGVLFGALMGALIFAKIARVQAFATVRFSNPITVVFGCGLITEADKGVASTCSLMGSTRNLVGSKSLDRPPRLSSSSRDATEALSEHNDQFPGLATETDKGLGSKDKGLGSTRNPTGSTENLMDFKKFNLPPPLPLSNRQVSETYLPPEDRLPCPVLEFRILNTLWNQQGGEIMDAAVKLVASRLDASERGVAGKKKKKKRKRALSGLGSFMPTKTVISAANAVRATLLHSQSSPSEVEDKAATSSSLRKPISLFPTSFHGANSSKRRPGNFLQNLNWSIMTSATPVQHSLDVPTDPFNSDEREISETQQTEESLGSDNVLTLDEGEDVTLAPRQIFYNLPVETDQYPSFKRIWNIRHVCNEDSPLLPKRVRSLIKANNGFWPKELNNVEAVRSAINFHEIIVSISGTCDATGASVYSQKVYQYADMIVGYTFATMFYQDDREGGTIRVDGSLLNDVTEQLGGGAEPIDFKTKPNFQGY